MGLVKLGRQYVGMIADAWDRFWFTPALPHTLALIRIATGAMLLYTHLVWAMELEGFLGARAWVDTVTLELFQQGQAKWSYLSSIQHVGVLWLHHAFTLCVMFCLMVGWFTRIAAPLAWFLQLMYVHRLTGSLFGLDQTTTMLAMYLMLAPCGAVWSVDAWRCKGRGSCRLRPAATKSVASNVATRLMQVHLCVIYLFGGVGKMRGDMWWDGHAVWYAVSSYEYQSLDMTWLASYPLVFSALSCITIFWEVFYCALVWPRLTRPLVLLIAVCVHGGIACFLGMITFGTIMIVANLSFISPQLFASRDS